MASGISKYVLKELFRTMLRIRMVEQRIIALYPSGLIRCSVHLCIGQEAVPAAVCHLLQPDDVIFCSHRNHGYYIARNGDLYGLFSELFGKGPGVNKGRTGSQQLNAPEIGFPASSSILAGIIPIAVGAALSYMLRGIANVSVADFGDGAIEQGVFFESLNFAALHRLPVVFICQNNLYATHAPLSVRQAGASIARKASMFGVPARTVDGNDAGAVYTAFRAAVERARQGKGPSLLECRTYRWMEHVGYRFDYHLGYRSKAELRRWQRRCPVRTCEKYLRSRHWMTDRQMDDLKRQIESELGAAVASAGSAPFPDAADMTAGVYAQADEG